MYQLCVFILLSGAAWGCYYPPPKCRTCSKETLVNVLDHSPGNISISVGNLTVTTGCTAASLIVEQKTITGMEILVDNETCFSNPFLSTTPAQSELHCGKEGIWETRSCSGGSKSITTSFEIREMVKETPLCQTCTIKQLEPLIESGNLLGNVTLTLGAVTIEGRPQCAIVKIYNEGDAKSFWLDNELCVEAGGPFDLTPTLPTSFPMYCNDEGKWNTKCPGPAGEVVVSENIYAKNQLM